MLFSYSVPARRFYRSPAIDDHDVRYDPERSLVDNVLAIARAEWGPVRAGRAEQLARLIGDAEPIAGRAPQARRWAAAILFAAAGADTSGALALIENRVGVGPGEIAIWHGQLRARLSDLLMTWDDAGAPLGR